MSLMPLKPHEWPLKLQKWAFRAFKTRSLMDWDLSGSKLRGFQRQKGKEMPSVKILAFTECRTGCL